MRNILLLLMFLLNLQVLSAQKVVLAGGGAGQQPEKSECLSHEQRLQIRHEMSRLKNEWLEKHPGALRSGADTNFIWPVGQSDLYNYEYVYGISNFVDHNDTFPNVITDYNCGQRSYDLTSGYNHPGTDMFVWPFQWRAVKYDLAHIVAADAGVILAIQDGNPDTNCSFEDQTAPWNAIYILHDNGFISWYGHLKKNSFTNKGQGDRVERGEFLGIMASSGFSTGPHLHFELYNDQSQLVDPYAGPCNDLNDSTYWALQKPYREPRINTLITHSQFPELSNCVPESGEENTYVQSCFAPGDPVAIISYFHDQRLGDTTFFKLIEPDGEVFDSWFFISPSTYNSSWWAWTPNFGTSPKTGIYTWEARFFDQVVTTTFYIGETEKQVADSVFACSSDQVTLTATGPTTEETNYFWNTGMQAPTIRLSHPGDYVVSVTRAQGCRETTYPVRTIETPEVDFPERFSRCPETPIELEAPSGFAGYQWSTGQTSQSITIGDDGQYNVDITTDEGCTFQLSTNVFTQKIVIPDSIEGSINALVGDTSAFSVIGRAGNQYNWEVTGGRMLSPNPSDTVLVVWDDPGSANVCVFTTDSTGCTGDAVCKRIDIDALTTTRNTLPYVRDIKVFPNPASDRIQVDWQLQETRFLRWEIRNTLGQVLFQDGEQYQPGQHTRQYDVNHLIPGLYRLVFRAQDGQIDLPFVVKR